LAIPQVIPSGGSGQVAHVKEHVFAAVGRLDESKSLLAVKPLKRSALHNVFYLFVELVRSPDAAHTTGMIVGATTQRQRRKAL
jgi:hypothetical protein